MKFRIIALALASMSVLPQAGAGTQAHVTLGNPTVTLRDLDASDGQAASFAWNGNWSLPAGFIAYNQTAWTVQPNGAGGTTYQATWDYAGSNSNYGQPPPILSNSYFLEADDGRASVLAQANSSGGLDHLTLEARALPGKGTVAEATPMRTFVLGPGSEVDISVALTGSVSIAAATPVTPVSGDITYPQSRSEIRVELAQLWMRGDEFSRFVVNDAFHQTNAVSMGFDHEVLTSTFSNTSSEPLSVVMLFRMQASTFEVLAATTAVPEPAHWALMAAGLLAVGVAARRRRG